MKPLSFALIFLFALCLFSCNKETFITSKDASISISSDTLHFDTLFTSTGSITQFFKIKNDNKQKLEISNVSLRGGTSSPFKINVSGTQGPEVKGIEIEANDSIYVFVSVSVNPSTANLPFIVQDSIEIAYNGNRRYVQLDSWGQNANFLRARVITGHVTWTNKLPYVIMGGLLVDTNAVLTIEKGCKIYCHADAPLIIDGTLQVFGEKYDSTRVHFRGDRLDEPYSNFPAAWPGIYFRGSSKDNVLNYAQIDNAYQALVSEQLSLNANPRLSLNQCIINNAYDAGILAVQSSVKASNCLISNCGKNIQLIYGGDYQFTHCTVAAYSSSYLSHKEPVLALSNSAKQDNITVSADLKAIFRNCIFWGESGFVDDEVISVRQGNTGFAVIFENCLLKVKTLPPNVVSSGIISNVDPAFDSINTQKHYFDFRLKNNSPVINKGVNTGLVFDLDGKPRMVNLPDLGAYEKQ